MGEVDRQRTASKPPVEHKMGGLSVLIGVLIVASGAQAQALCPESCISLGDLPPVCSSTPARDTSNSGYCLDPPGAYEGRGRYSLALGTIRADAYSCYTTTAAASVVSRDRFRLVGPSGGGPIAFEARLYVNGGATPYGSVSAGISELGGDSRSASDFPNGGFNETLVLPLSHVVGEEFELALNASATASQTGYALGNLSFVLPPGYGVTSCGGFTGDGAVSIRRMTWGALKLGFR